MNFDIEKNITIKDQFKIMIVILGISCLLFSIVYLVKSCSTPSEQVQSDVSQIDTSDISQPDTSLVSDVISQESSVPQPSVDLTSEVSSQTLKLENIKYVTKGHDEIYNGDLILVNKDYECHHDGEETVSLYENRSSSYGIANNTVYVNGDIVDNMNDMFDDFADIYGYTDIMVACAYRSYATQVRLFNQEVENQGDNAEQWVAPPGFSEHQTGYVFDLNLNINNGVSGIKYDGTGIYSWINQNCYKYGFILRYLQGKEDITGYEYEPWHFRYVGASHATYIMREGITLEEYIDIVHMYSIDEPLIIDGDDGEQWCVYYVKAADNTTSIPVSADYSYEISGDNFSGFIVTQKNKIV